MLEFLRRVAFMATGLALGLAPLISSRLALAQCDGDCNYDEIVEKTDLVEAVNIALGHDPYYDCYYGDVNQDQTITVDEILVAVNHAENNCAPIPTPTVNPQAPPLDRGLMHLGQGDLRDANTAFGEAVTAQPNNAAANMYYAMTRLATAMLDAPAIVDLLNRSGVVIEGGTTDVCNLAVHVPPKDAIPGSAPRTGEIVETLRTVLMPEVQNSLGDLKRISESAVISFDLHNLPRCVSPPTQAKIVEIDYADVLALMAGINGVGAWLDLLTAYNVDVSVGMAANSSAQGVFNAEPNLLTLQHADRLITARNQFDAMLASTSQAIDAVRQETDDQSNDVFVIQPDDQHAADQVKLIVDLMRQALVGEVTLPIDVITGEVVLMDIGLLSQERLNLNPFFTGQFTSLRPLLPPFDANGDFDQSRFPDPTFGGMAPDFTQFKIDNFLRDASFR